MAVHRRPLQLVGSAWRSEAGTGHQPAERRHQRRPQRPLGVRSGRPPPALPALQQAVSRHQYQLPGSDGITWTEIDPARLRLTETPSQSQSIIVGAGTDLWTANAGYNQDLGIFVSDNSGPDQLLAWKESGGFAGTYSPNAAFVQALLNGAAGHTYVFKVKWKTNRDAPGATIFAGAGTAVPYSPTSLTTKRLSPSAATSFVSTTAQQVLPNSDGASWMPLGAGVGLLATLNPGADGSAVLGANADLFTGSPGVNQDIGILVSDNGGPRPCSPGRRAAASPARSRPMPPTSRQSTP